MSRVLTNLPLAHWANWPWTQAFSPSVQAELGVSVANLAFRACASLPFCKVNAARRSAGAAATRKGTAAMIVASVKRIVEGRLKLTKMRLVREVENKLATEREKEKTSVGKEQPGSGVLPSKRHGFILDFRPLLHCSRNDDRPAASAQTCDDAY